MPSCCGLVQICPLNCPQKVHNNAHWRFALTHLHLFVHDFLHTHLNSSWHALAASGRVVQFMGYVASSFSLCQAHICGGGSSGVPISDWSQMCPAWYAALFTFWYTASSVGRMLSILRFWVNISFLASFTLLRGLGVGCAGTGEQQLFPTALNLLWIFAFVHVITKRKYDLD